MKKNAILPGACITLLFLLFCVGNVFGGAFDNSAVGLKAMAMGCLLTGTADDASAVYSNPAGMAFHEKNTWYAEIYEYYAPTGFEYSADSITDKSDEAFIIPGLFITRRFDSWAFGFGAYIPYAGGGTSYDNFQNWGLDLESFAGWFAFTPAVAYRISENLSVGMGLSLYKGEMEGKNSYDPDKVPVMTEMKSEYDGISGYGGHIGFLYKPTDKFGVGFTARSEVPIEMDGEVKVPGFKFDSEVEFTFPYSFTLGFGYEPCSNLTLGLSFYYLLWNHMDEMKIKTEGQSTVNDPTGYKNSWNIGLGMEYRTNAEFIFRAGLKYDQGATKVKWLDPRSNDVDKLTPSIGIAYKINKSVEMNIAALRVFGLEKEYNSRKYDQNNYSFIVGFRFKY